MKNDDKSILFIYVFLVITLLAVAGLFFRVIQLENRVISALEPFQIPQGLELGEKAPKFSLHNLDGVFFVSDEVFLKEKTLLVFSSTTCPACQEFWPSLQIFAENNPNVQIVMITTGTLTEERQMKKEEGFKFEILQADQSILGDYRIPGTPYLYLVNNESEIIFSGFSDQMDLLVKILQN